MARNASGVYTLPAAAGNPVVSGTSIEPDWANQTLNDIAAEITGSLPRNGSAGMTAPLLLSGNAAANLVAVPKQQLDAAVTSLTNSLTITGAATTIKANNLTVSRALVSDASGKVAVSAVTSAEVGYLGGVTSAIQTQLNGKQASDATLTALAGLNTTTGLVEQTGTDTFTKTPVTAFAKTLLDDTTNTAARATLGIVASSVSASGLVELATTAETTAGTDAVRAVTPAGVAAAIPAKLNAAGSAPMYACRAWVNFNGTGSVSINASGNVSSITDNGTGDYTVNFATAMPTSHYAVVGTALTYQSANTTPGVVMVKGTAATGPDLKTTSQCRIAHVFGNASSMSDSANINLTFFA